MKKKYIHPSIKIFNISAHLMTLGSLNGNNMVDPSQSINPSMFESRRRDDIWGQSNDYDHPWDGLNQNMNSATSH